MAWIKNGLLKAEALIEQVDAKVAERLRSDGTDDVNPELTPQPRRVSASHAEDCDQLLQAKPQRASSVVTVDAAVATSAGLVEAALALLSAVRADVAACEDEAADAERAQYTSVAARAAAVLAARGRTLDACTALEALRADMSSSRRDGAARDSTLESRAAAAAASLAQTQRALEAARIELDTAKASIEAHTAAEAAAVEEARRLRARADAVRRAASARRTGPQDASAKQQQTDAESSRAAFDAACASLRARAQEAARRRSEAQQLMLAPGLASARGTTPTGVTLAAVEALEVRLREATDALLAVSARAEAAASTKVGLLMRLDAANESLKAARSGQGPMAYSAVQMGDEDVDEEMGHSIVRQRQAQPVAASPLSGPLFDAISTLAGRQRARMLANALAALDATVLRLLSPLGRSPVGRAAVAAYVALVHLYVAALIVHLG